MGSRFTEEDHKFMQMALQEAQSALDESEVPVGCVFVYQNKVIARGRNATNRTLNGTRHAELVAIDDILLNNKDSVGYKNRDIFKDCVLYVTVEPCIMCAGALKLLNIGKVIYGCGNDRFGGNGNVASIHLSNPDVIGKPDISYPCIGGLYLHEAVILLRKFYLRENVNAIAPKKKTNRTLNLEVPKYES